MLTYHIGADGMKLYRDGELIAHLHPDHYVVMIADMSKEFRARWDTTGRQDNAESSDH